VDGKAGAVPPFFGQGPDRHGRLGRERPDRRDGISRIELFRDRDSRIKRRHFRVMGERCRPVIRPAGEPFPDAGVEPGVVRDVPWGAAQRPDQGVGRFMPVGQRVRGQAGDGFEAKPHFGRTGFPQHPVETDVGQPLERIAAAHIGMHSWKPELGDAMSGVPGRWHEILALFVDGHGVQAIGHAFGEVEVREVENVPLQIVHGVDTIEKGHTEGAHRVPHADEADRAGLGGIRGGGLQPGVLVLEGPPALVGQLPAACLHGQFGRQQTDFGDKCGQAAYGVGPPGKAEQEKLVAGLVGPGEEQIAVEDLAVKARAGGPGQRVVAGDLGPHAFEIEGDLLRGVPIEEGVDGLGLGDGVGLARQDVEEPVHIGVDRGPVPGAVGADNDVFGHPRLLPVGDAAGNWVRRSSPGGLDSETRGESKPLITYMHI